ncbi:MAG: ABC transporter permease [Stenotrophomonas sp.]|uniref:ABC transporter permease n=1 Tax=Stenotrophomonas sp. TaxID=69392 RepID=UPI003D6D5679
MVHLLLFFVSLHWARPKDSLLVGAGFAISAAALSVMLAIPAGINRIAAKTGQDNIAVVLSSGAFDEAGSSLGVEQVAVISALPVVARDSAGVPLVAPQFLANAKLRGVDGSSMAVLVRGVTSSTWDVADASALPARTAPVSGSRQLLIGGAIRSHIDELAGGSIQFRGQDWLPSGVLEANGGAWESELWADMADLQAAYNRPGRVSVLWLALESAEGFQTLRKMVADDPRLEGVRVMRQSEYYEQQLGTVSGFVNMAALGVSILLGAGAVLAISTTLGMVLERRRREMATLGAIGFDRVATAMAVSLDLIQIGLVFTVAVIAVAWFLLDGVSFGTSGVNQAVYAHFVIDAGVAAMIVAYSIVLCLLSVLFPLWKLVVGSVVASLRD